MCQFGPVLTRPYTNSALNQLVPAQTRPYVSKDVKPTSQLNINPAVTADRWIFTGCLLFEMGSSSADFFDVEQCRKPSSSHMTIAAGRLFGHHQIFLPNGQNFLPMPWRPSSGLLVVTARCPVDRHRKKMNPPITGRSLFGGQPVIGRGPTDVLLVQFATRVCNFQCLL